MDRPPRRRRVDPLATTARAGVAAADGPERRAGEDRPGGWAARSKRPPQRPRHSRRPVWWVIAGPKRGSRPGSAASSRSWARVACSAALRPGLGSSSAPSSARTGPALIGRPVAPARPRRVWRARARSARMRRPPPSASWPERRPTRTPGRLTPEWPRYPSLAMRTPPARLRRFGRPRTRPRRVKAPWKPAAGARGRWRQRPRRSRPRSGRRAPPRSSC